MDWAGTDYYFDKDLKASNQGDYTLVSGRQNVDMAVKRRLKTPQGSLFYDKFYGNPIFNKLSSIADNNFADSAKKALDDCMKQETRIKVQSISLKTIPKERRIIFNIAYTYNTSSDSSIAAVQGGIDSGGVTV